MAGRRRRGIGVALPTVMGLLLVLLGAAAMQLFSTGSSLSQAARDAGGAVAEQVALSALEEALWKFQQSVNDPDTELYQVMRRAIVDGQPGDLDLTSFCRPSMLPAHLSSSRHAPFYRRVDIPSFGLVARIPGIEVYSPHSGHENSRIRWSLQSGQ